MSERREKEKRRVERMEQSIVAEIKATRKPPAWKESSFFWGLVGLGVTALSLVIKPPPVFEAFLLLVAWLCFSGSCWIAFRECEPKRRVVGAALSSLLIGIFIVVMWAYTEGEPVARLSIQGEKDPHSFIPQGNQPAPPKARRFARVMVTAEGKSIANVRASVSKINDADRHLQLHLSSQDTLFKFPRSFPLEGSVNLNAGDSQYFDVLIECNGTVCDDGRLVIPSIENGQRFLFVLSEGDVDVKPHVLTIKATGDGARPVTRNFLVSPQDGKLLLKPQSDG